MPVIAIGRIVKPVSEEARRTVMAAEVPATLQLYLSGTITQMWSQLEAPGVVFLLDVVNVEAARQVIEALPLVVGGYAQYDFIPVGPLAPLGRLLPVAA